MVFRPLGLRLACPSVPTSTGVSSLLDCWSTPIHRVMRLRYLILLHIVLRTVATYCASYQPSLFCSFSCCIVPRESSLVHVCFKACLACPTLPRYGLVHFVPSAMYLSAAF